MNFFEKKWVKKLAAFCFGKWPHFFAGLLLLLFAASHFMMLTVGNPSQHSISTVFPFLTMWTVYLLAGIFELTIAITSLINRGKTLPNLAIFTFLVVIGWYRWALSYTGGDVKTCDCLGVFGEALNLSKTQEKVIPIVVLILLALTIVPWFLRELMRSAKIMPPWLNKLRGTNIIGLIMFAFLCHTAYGQQTIEVAGQYDSYHYNPKNGALFTNYTRHVSFTCTFSGQAWSIYVTNIDTDPEGLGLRTPWEELVYDGTNTYTLIPEMEKGKDYAIYATVSPGSLFVRDYDEWLDFYAIWLTYGLCPNNLLTNESGIVEVPLPWYNSRNSPMSHGFEWKITPMTDGRFMSECQVLRNTNLDLSDVQEMLRTDINAPVSVGGRNHWTELLQVRRESYLQNSVQATYKCKELCETNGVLLPMVSEMVIYDSIFGTKHPTAQAQVKASNVSVRKGLVRLLPAVAEQTFVRDYRYRKVYGMVGHISPDLEYSLAPGALWDNPDILLQAEKNRMSFPADFGLSYGKHRSHFVWLILAIAVAPIIFFVWSTISKKQK